MIHFSSPTYHCAILVEQTKNLLSKLRLVGPLNNGNQSYLAEGEPLYNEGGLAERCGKCEQIFRQHQIELARFDVSEEGSPAGAIRAHSSM
jgi:hypothetical protein